MNCQPPQIQCVVSSSCRPSKSFSWSVSADQHALHQLLESSKALNISVFKRPYHSLLMSCTPQAFNLHHDLKSHLLTQPSQLVTAITITIFSAIAPFLCALDKGAVQRYPQEGKISCCDWFYGKWSLFVYVWRAFSTCVFLFLSLLAQRKRKPVNLMLRFPFSSVHTSQSRNSKQLSLCLPGELCFHPQS